MTSEKIIEQTLTASMRNHGYLCWKLVAPGTTGVPDRIILAPNGKTVFVEVKAPGKKPTPIQKHRHQQLAALGHQVHILDTIDGIQRIINAIQTP